MSARPLAFIFVKWYPALYEERHAMLLSRMVTKCFDFCMKNGIHFVIRYEEEFDLVKPAKKDPFPYFFQKLQEVELFIFTIVLSCVRGNKVLILL